VSRDEGPGGGDLERVLERRWYDESRLDDLGGGDAGLGSGEYLSGNAGAGDLALGDLLL